MEHDLICVGFGLQGLALATAFADRHPNTRLLVIERKQEFKSNLGYHRTEQASSSPFLKDLVTLQNPRSEYTFVNFLHENKLLLGFTNVSQLKPSRHLLQRYLEWAAGKLTATGWVVFGQEVVKTQPSYDHSTRRVKSWSVKIRDVGNGCSRVVNTKCLVFTASPNRSVSRTLSRVDSRRIRYLHEATRIVHDLSTAANELKIAVLGADQRAIELFQELIQIEGQHRVTMIFPGSALRVEDETPFVREMTGGADERAILSRVPPEVRRVVLATDVSAKFPTVDLGTLEDLYATLYLQHIDEPDTEKHRFKIAPNSVIYNATMCDGAVDLEIFDSSRSRPSTHSGLYDLMITDTIADTPTLRAPMPSLVEGRKDKSLNVDSDYAIDFGKNLLNADVGAWALGTLTDPKHRTDDLATLAESAHRAHHSIIAKIKAQSDHPTSQNVSAML